jgi:hypothetical protein
MSSSRFRQLVALLILAALTGTAAAQAPAPAPAVAPAASAPAAAARPSSPRAMDRVELDASRITGNRELPRVMYVVPWRQPSAGQVDGRPVNSLVYELSTPVDREVARRQVRYGKSAAALEENAVR